MAKTVGLVSFVGTLNGVNFYMLNGKPVARKAGGGFNGKKIKSSPKMVRVRENNSEFGNCSRLKKVFKDALLPFFQKYHDVSLHSRMMRLFIDIKNYDLVSERGKRSVKNGLQHEEGKKMLGKFEFTNLDLPIDNGDFDSSGFGYVLNGFDSRLLDFPKGATHLKVEYGVLVLDFDVPKAVLHVSDSVLIAAETDFGGFSFDVGTVLAGTGMAIGVLCYRFEQEVNGVLYPFNEKKGFGLKVVGMR